MGPILSSSQATALTVTASRPKKIRAAIGCPEAEIFFLVGGTQTNQVVLDALLRAYDGVIAAESGHVNVHEAGAIEHGGHKVLALGHTDGKLSAETVREYVETFYADGNYTHMVFPGAVYISHRRSTARSTQRRSLPRCTRSARRTAFRSSLTARASAMGLPPLERT